MLTALLTIVARPAEAKPNVLFLICDDLNCDLACYGHDQVKSPNIDKLAERGLRFDRAYCQFPLCGPSRASFMTGMYPDQSLIRTNAIRIRKHLPDVITMSQLFRNNGYKSTRIGKIYHYNVPADIGKDGHDDPASWDAKINPRGRDKTEEAKVHTLRKGRYGATLSWLAADGTDAEQTDGIAALEAVKVLEEHAVSKQPFYLAVGLYRPHTPYVAPKKYFGLHPRERINVPKIPKGYLKTLPAPCVRMLTRHKEEVNLDNATARKVLQAYYASISFADAQLGIILESLDRLGLTDNTVIVFTSDHGYHMGEHGHYQKMTLFESAARVPLIISAPDMKTAGKVAAAPAEMVDFYPTLAELCGLEAPPHISGVSLAPLLQDAQAAPRKDALTQIGTDYSLRTQRYRYTQWGKDGAKGVELYDHESDPLEMKNLANSPDTAELRKKLSLQLRKRIEDANRTPTGIKRIAGPERKRLH
jgi:iduronate 2-sulfatase